MKKYIPVLFILFFAINNCFCEVIEFSASNMSGKAGKENATTKLSGNAYIKTETMEIHAEEVELSGEDFRYIKAKGYVEGKNLEAKMDFSCDELDYDRKEKKAVLKGNVVFSDVENDVEAEAEMIEYDQETEIAILQINIVLKQEDNVCTGSYGIYNKEKQLLELSGNAQVMQNEDMFRAQHITLNLDTQEIFLGGNVKGSVTDTKVTEDNSGETEQSEQTEQTEQLEQTEKTEQVGTTEQSEKQKNKEKR